MAEHQGLRAVELYEQCLGVVAKGFGIIERESAKFTISEKHIVEKANAGTKKNEITSIEEICLVRGYNVSKM